MPSLFNSINSWHGDNTSTEPRHDRAGSTGFDGDYSADLHAIRARFQELEAKMSQIRPGQSDDLRPQDIQHDGFNAETETPLENPRSARIPAVPKLHRIKWVPFKNLYLDEAIYAIDVLMGL